MTASPRPAAAAVLVAVLALASLPAHALGATSHPWWDLWPRPTGGDATSTQTALAAAQALDANMITAFGGLSDEGRGPMFRQYNYLGAESSQQGFQSAGIHVTGWLEGEGQSRAFIGAVEQQPNGSYVMDAQLGAAQVMSTLWSWDSNGAGVNANANSIIWFSVASFVNSEPWQGSYLPSNPAYASIPAPTYPDGTSALGYQNTYPVGSPMGKGDPRNALLYDATASKGIDGSFELSVGQATGTNLTGFTTYDFGGTTGTQATGDISFGKDTASPFWLAYNTNALQWLVAGGGDGVWMDNSTGWDFMGSQPTTTAFGEWSVSKFQTFLAQNPQIPVPGGASSLDVRAYLQSRLAAWYPSATPANLSDPNYAGWTDARFTQDPIWRAFLAFKAITAYNHTKGMYDALHAAATAAGKDPNSLYLGGNDIPDLALGMLKGDELDGVNSEFSPTFQLAYPNNPVGYPPSGHTGVHYATAASLERSQHSIVWYYLTDPTLQGHPNLGEVLGYEALANNSILNTEVAWEKSPGTATTMAAVNKTIDRLTPVLGYRYRKGGVAVVYSTQSQHLLMAPGGFVNGGKTQSTATTTSELDPIAGFAGWAEALEDRHTPYRVIPDYKLTSAALSDVSVVIFPHVLAIDPNTVTNVIVPYLASGGTILVSGTDAGSVQTRDQLYVNNSGPLLYNLTQQPIYAGHAIFVAGNPGFDFYVGSRQHNTAQATSGQTQIGTAISSLEQNGRLPVTVAAGSWASSVWITHYQADTGSRFFYDFLNVNLTLATDALVSSPGGSVTLFVPPALQGSALTANWYDADGAGPVAVALTTVDAQHLSAAIPGFRIYGTLTLDGVPVPKLTNAGPGCNNDECLWMTGANFEVNSQVLLISPSSGKTLATYSGTQLGIQPTSITLALAASSPELNAFLSAGLNVQVYNSDTETSSGIVFVKAPPVVAAVAYDLTSANHLYYSAYGTNLSDGTAAHTQIAVSCATGGAIPATVSYVSAGQINYYVAAPPYAGAWTGCTVAVNVQGNATSAPVAMAFPLPTAPVIAAGGVAYDSTLSGLAYLSIYGTGLGNGTASQTTATAQCPGQAVFAAKVIYAAAGQVNVTIPSPSASETCDLTVTFLGQASNTVASQAIP